MKYITASCGSFAYCFLLGSNFCIFKAKSSEDIKSWSYLYGMTLSKLQTQSDFAFSNTISPASLQKRNKWWSKNLFAKGISVDITILLKGKYPRFSDWGKRFKMECAEEYKLVLIKHWIFHYLLQPKGELPTSLTQHSRTSTIFFFYCEFISRD